MKRNYVLRSIIAIVSISILILMIPSSVSAYATKNQKTNVEKDIVAIGSYANWEGVSNVCQFVDNNGEFSFAYDDGKYVRIVKTKDGKPQKKAISLKKKYSLFGGVTVDSNGNYYLVTGKENGTEDTSVNTIFVSKYNKSGKHIKTVGDNGGSSLAYYYDSTFYTKRPFNAGTCDIAINGDTLAVNYARGMYNGHQSNSVLVINIKTMEKIQISSIYNSHSFGQRVLPYQKGFVFASEGDCYPRAFSFVTTGMNNEVVQEGDSYHFWVRENALTDWDMYAINDNFAHMGGLAGLSDGKVAFVASSVPSMNSKANKEKEQVFLQIFDPTQDLSKQSTYITKGTRTGIAGPNGNEKETDYGVKWLTDIGKDWRIENPQVVSNGDDKIVVFYEKYYEKNYDNVFKGVYYKVLDKNGKVLTKTTLYSKDANLNPSRMPVYSDGTIYWVGNNEKDSKIHVYQMKLD